MCQSMNISPIAMSVEWSRFFFDHHNDTFLQKQQFEILHIPTLKWYTAEQKSVSYIQPQEKSPENYDRHGHFHGET